MAEYIVGTKTSLGYEGDDFACGVKKERIVRCRDCKWASGLQSECQDFYQHKDPDGFCKWGKRREDE